MNSLIDFFARKGLFVNLITVFVLVLGLYSMLTIERKVMPNVQFEWVSIVTPFPGASAEEVERLITNRLEQDLKEVDGIKKMTSTSADGQSFIGMQLDPDQTTVEIGKADIQDIVDRFNDLPENAEDPLVISLESNLEPVIQVSVSSNLSEKEIRKAAKFLEDEIEEISGVAKVVIDGLRDIEYRVEAKPQSLKKYQLSLIDISRALQLQNVNVPGGLIDGSGGGNSGELDFIVRTIGEFKTIEDVKNVVIKANAFGQPIRVSEVATVKETFEKAAVLQRTNALPSMNLTVLKKENSDAITLVDKVKETVGRLKTKIHPEIKISYINDTSYFIRRRLGVLTGNFMIGLGLVLLVLTLFMPFKISLITSLGIPFSFFGSFYLMNHFGVSFNLITMMGLIIVVGMLVDDAVVVTENIFRFIEKGMKPIDAAIKGAQEIWLPVTASVMTTVMAFTPILVMSGIFGKFVRYISIAVIFALLISLYECFFVLPHHLGAWVKVDSIKKKTGYLAVIRKFWEERVIVFYKKILHIALRRRYLVLLGLFSLFVGTGLFATKFMSFILFPKDGIEAFVIQAEAPIGTPLERTKELMKSVEMEISKISKEDMDDFTTKIGLQRVSISDPNSKRGSHYAQTIVYLKPELERKKTAVEIMESLRKSIGTPVGLTKVNLDFIQGGPPVGKAISIGVKGKKYSEILPVVEKIKEITRNQPGALDIEDNYYPGKKEIRVIVDQLQAAAAGISTSEIGLAVRSAYEGSIATKIRLLDEEIDVRVSLPVKERSNAKALNDVMILNNRGALVPLINVASFTEGQAIAEYNHENNRREVKVYGSIDEKITSSIAMNNLLKSEIIEIEKRHPNVSIVFGGENEDTAESMKSLMEAFVMALMGIIAILILTFKNLYQPFLVVLTIPLGVISIIWAFALHQMPLSFLAIIGMIALGGVIVNNAIVLIDFVNRNRAEGLSKVESIVSAGSVRLRPIFLTTMTTVCGILPTAYGIGGLDQFVVPVAMALGWGLLLGSMQTVFFLPVFIAVLDDIVELVNRLFRRESKQLNV